VADLPRTFGPYSLLKSLGTGGTGEVYLARPEDSAKKLPSPMVIKCLHPQLASQPDFVKRFDHEAKVALAIDSPHVAKVYDVGRVDETYYIAMQYLAGWTVARVIKDLQEAGGSASIDSVADVIRGGLLGLGALHGADVGAIHRDVAPKNLMIGEDGVTRLIDLGLGKSSLQDWRTNTGVVMGSPGYMAPEQVTAENVDRRSDLYAIGIVLWEFLTLKRYIKRAPVPIMLRAQVSPSFTAPSQLRAEVPAKLDAVCAKALELDPARRYQTAAEFIDALDEAVPPREEEEPLATIVGAMLWGELGQSKTEITKLLSITPAQRAARDAEPGFIDASMSTPIDTISETPAALATPMSAMPAPAPPAGVPPRAVFLLMGLTLLIGLGIGALLLSDRPQHVALPPPRVEVAAPRPAVAPVVAPTPAPPPPAPPPPPQKKVTKAEEPAPAPRPQKVDPPKSDRDRLLALMNRARALRSTLAGTPAEAEVTGLLAKAAQEASAAEVNAQVLSDLEKSLHRLENQR
jgi:eukaryotic-like serine/threonine-protein kinase